MDNNELISLESKAEIIVDTLGTLEKEVHEYKKKNKEVEYAIVNISGISNQITEASRELYDAAELFNKSDYTSAMKEIDKRIGQLRDTEEAFDSKLELNTTAIERILSEQKILHDEVSMINQSIHRLHEIERSINRLEALTSEMTAMLHRIDQNTQKGFGKIKG